jgi:hypothetical protein
MLEPGNQRSIDMAESSGWYADPTGRHTYRYWGGSRWSNQVSDGGTAGVDPIDVDEATAAIPPAPGTQAPGLQPTPTAGGPQTPGVEVTQRSGGSGAGIVGVLVGAIIVIVILFIVFNNADDGDTTPTDAPSVTEPIEEPAPTNAPATSAS